MKRKSAFPWLPVSIWTGVVALFGIGIAYTPALGDGTTWTLPYGGTVSTTGAAIGVTNTGTGYGLSGTANVIGVNGMGTGTNSCGVQGIGSLYGVTGLCSSSSGGYGIYGNASGSGGYGVYGLGSIGVEGYSNRNFGSGVYGVGTYGISGYSSQYTGAGLFGVGTSGAYGVYADTDSGDAVNASSYSGRGVFGYSQTNAGVMGMGYYGVMGYATTGYMAGYFSGNVTVTGNLYVNGTIYKSAVNFKIDHPQDPVHKYLIHSCVESDEMMNLYRGNVTLDSDGKATVILPAWFQAENRDFCYQLTCIGKPALVYISRKIQDNQFEIAGGEAGMEVSWQVTGVRNDAYAKAHPLKVEVDKPASEQGKYLHPEEFGQPQSKGIDNDLVKPLEAPKLRPSIRMR
jgi:hypothetical protein